MEPLILEVAQLISCTSNNSTVFSRFQISRRKASFTALKTICTEFPYHWVLDANVEQKQYIYHEGRHGYLDVVASESIS